MTQMEGIFGQAAPERLGKYPLLSVIGTGSMGIVYKSFDPQINRAIALKTIRRELLDDDVENFSATFRIEAQTTGSLTHPGIVCVYEYGEAEGYAYIAMEYVEGHSLRDCFERKVRFNTDQAINMLTQLLKALQYAHEHGVWHRDVKPANILLMGDGQLKVTDFGIARVESLNLEHADSIMGTPGFIAPEMYLGEAFDHRIDLFAAGVVLYHLLAGVPPFVGTPEKIMFKVCYETPLPASVVARQPSLQRFDAVVLKALARRPEDRFSSAAEFLETLLLAQSGGPVSADQTMMVSRRSRQTSGPARVDETMLIARRPKPGAPAGNDETMIVSRRTAPDDANLTIIRPLPPADSAEANDSPVTEPLRLPPILGRVATDPASHPQANTPSLGPPQLASTESLGPPHPASTESLGPPNPPVSTPSLGLPHPASTASRGPPRPTSASSLTLARPANISSPSPRSNSSSSLTPPRSTSRSSLSQRETAANSRLSQRQPTSDSRLSPRQSTGDSPLFQSPSLTSSSPSHPSGWDPQALAQVEKHLARSLGPIARVLVRNASREATDLASLIHSLAEKIANPDDRDAFLKATGTGVALTSVIRRPYSDTESQESGGAPLTPEYIERASQLLAIHLGPIAKVLAKRAAQSGSSQEQFVAALAAHLNDDRERTRFLKALA